MRALGLLVELGPTEELTRFDYYLPLANVLMHAASASRHKDAPHLEQLAHSYSDDILNLANLASRLLWFEGITPDVWHSHDLVSVAVDTSSYFVTLQTACDIMADVIATLAARTGTAPSESFHSLTEWVKRHPNRIAKEFIAVSAHLPWFEEINTVRTKLVHRGGDIWTYTERVRFHWAVHLHPKPNKMAAVVNPQANNPASKEGTQLVDQRIRDRGFLLSDLRRLTRSLLSFSARLERSVRKHQGFAPLPRRHAISGIFVPALHHIVRDYKPPEQSASLILSAKCLTACGDYATAAYLGYPNGFWWRFLISVAEALAVGPEVAIIPIRADDAVHDAKIVFAWNGRRYGVILCDSLSPNEHWVRQAGESARKFMADYSLGQNVFVAGTTVAADDNTIKAACSTLPAVVGRDPRRVAAQAIAALRSSSPPLA